MDQGEMALASATLAEALGLRRGEPLAEFAYAGFADTERAQLDELTLVAIETRAVADLELGRHWELAGETPPRCRPREARVASAPAIVTSVITVPSTRQSLRYIVSMRASRSPWRKPLT